MAGYTRQDTANNIANGNVIDADDFDAEYNQLESAFNASSGHSHDGTAGEGAPITKVGPSQDLVVSATQVLPKTTNTLDLGSASVQFKDAHFDGTVDADAFTGPLTGDVTGNLTGNVTGNVTGTVSDISNHNTGDLSEGTNKYYTDERVDDRVSSLLVGGTNISLTYNDVSNQLTIDAASVGGYDLSNNDTDDVAEGTTNLYYTDARARGAVSVTDSGGDGSLAYNSGTGVITYTGPSASEARAHFSAGTGVTLSSGEIAIGQAVGTSSDVTFNDVTVSGDLTVSGTTTTVNTETINLADNQIVLNSNFTGSSPTENGGIEIERGTQTNKTLVWNETDDKWTVGSETFVAGTFEGALTGNADTATALATARTISLTGGASGSVSFDGSADVSIAATVAGSTSQNFSALDLTVADEIIMTAGDQDWKFEVSGTNTLSASYNGSTMFNISNGGYIDDTSFWNGEIRHSNLYGAITEQFTNDTSAPTGAVNFDCKTQGVYLNSANASGNVQLNFRGDSGTTFANIVPVGKSLTAVYALRNGTTPYYVSDVKIDGTSQLSSSEFFWQEGEQPSSGNASGLDVYTFTFFRRSSSGWTIFASRTFYGT